MPAISATRGPSIRWRWIFMGTSVIRIANGVKLRSPIAAVAITVPGRLAGPYQVLLWIRSGGCLRSRAGSVPLRELVAQGQSDHSRAHRSLRENELQGVREQALIDVREVGAYQGHGPRILRDPERRIVRGPSRLVVPREKARRGLGMGLMLEAQL